MLFRACVDILSVARSPTVCGLQLVSPELLLTFERAHLGLNIRDLRFFKGESKA